MKKEKKSKNGKVEFKLQNPFKYLKHIWKDPVTSPAECDRRKKEVLPMLIVNIVFVVVGASLTDWVEPLLYMSLIGVFGCMFSGLLFFIYNRAKKRFEALICDACKEMATLENKEDYEKYVSFEVESVDFTMQSDCPKDPPKSGESVRVTASGREMTTVKIYLTCPNCGAIKTFRAEFRTFSCSIEKKTSYVESKASEILLKAEIGKVYENIDNIPVTIHSINHPQYGKKGVTIKNPHIGDVAIKYRRPIEELVQCFFLNNEVNARILK